MEVEKCLFGEGENKWNSYVSLGLYMLPPPGSKVTDAELLYQIGSVGIDSAMENSLQRILLTLNYVRVVIYVMTPLKNLNFLFLNRIHF